jgi:hypothetical protein
MIAFQMLPRNCDTAYTSEMPNIKRSGAITKTRKSAFAAYKQLNSNTDIRPTSQQPQCFADDGTSMPIHKAIMFQPAAQTGFGAALNGKAVQLAQFVRRHPFGRDAPAVFRIEPHSA